MVMKPLAALIFFTRLPLWRWVDVPAHYYKNLVAWWAMSGWVTAFVSASVLWLSAQLLPFEAAVVLALIARVLFTGGLHEDGLADFLDGFGGGQTRDRILAIMKDSHIGSYGVLGLILYFLLKYTLLISLPLHLAMLVIVTSDPGAKFIAAQIINRLPYARKEEESKLKLTYTPMTKGEIVISALFGLLPFLLFRSVTIFLAFTLPVLIFLMIIRYLRRKIGGYTGDCCGALFLICEIALLTNLIVFYKWNLF